MCGRFTITSAADLADEDGLAGLELDRSLATDELFVPRFNVAPTQTVAIVRLPALKTDPESSDRSVRPQLLPARWGLTPTWRPSNGSSTNRPVINARSETASEKPMFKEAFASRRCLVPADGFLEWERTKSKRQRGTQPHWFGFKTQGLACFAGLWNQGKGDSPDSFCILTTRANDLVTPSHDRMPVVVAPSHYDLWLHGIQPNESPLDGTAHEPLFKPMAPELMTARRVGARVNSVRNDSPDLLEEVAEEPTNLSLF